MMMTMMMMMKTPSWWVTRIWCTCGRRRAWGAFSAEQSLLSAHCASARNCSSYVPSLLSRVCSSDSHLSRVSLLTVPLLSTAEQSLLLLCASSAQSPHPIGEEESNSGVQSWASPARVYKMIWYSQFSKTTCLLPIWTWTWTHLNTVGTLFPRGRRGWRRA